MKKYNKGIPILLLIFVVLLGAWFMKTEAEAAKSTYPEALITTYYKNDSLNRDYNGAFFPKNAKVKNLKSNNKKMLEVSWNKNSPEVLSFQVHKAGRTTFSFDLVVGRKTKHYKAYAVIQKYQNPCTSFKVGKKDYAPEFNKSMQCSAWEEIGKKVKISVKAKKGWLLAAINPSISENPKIVKNNSTIKKPGYIYVKFINKKSGKQETLMWKYKW